MKRRGIGRGDIHALRGDYEALFIGGGSFRERIEKLAASQNSPLVEQMIAFIRAGGSRPLTMAVKRGSDEDQ
jgi:UDP-N-acetylglucosamine acyltransferase